MIATLRGMVTEKAADTVVLEAGGVGYGLLVTTEDHGTLQLQQPAYLYIYEHIRETAHDLFAFLKLDTKKLFELLLSVNGVGPKMALSILSVGNPAAVRSAIASGDTKYITQASGVGKRVAERVVVDLKDKVGLVGVDLSTTGLLQSDAVLSSDEAVQALMSLGYQATDAAKALESVDPALSTEERVKQALRAA
ncbi:MAG: Holliday junction branch migration protein RuvA [Candidatus Saccharimonadales bacterium]